MERSDTFDERRPTVLRKVDVGSSERVLSSVRVELLIVEARGGERQRKGGGICNRVILKELCLQKKRASRFQKMEKWLAERMARIYVRREERGYLQRMKR
jgi:hypothetical protein